GRAQDRQGHPLEGPAPMRPATPSPAGTGQALSMLSTDVEESLRASVRDLLTARCTPARVIATYDGDHDLAPELWRSLSVDLGLAGLLVPQDRGGAAATGPEAARVLCDAS